MPSSRGQGSLGERRSRRRFHAYNMARYLRTARVQLYGAPVRRFLSRGRRARRAAQRALQQAHAAAGAGRRWRGSTTAFERRDDMMFDATPSHGRAPARSTSASTTQHLTPLWDVLGALVIPQPKSPCVSALWRFADVREHLMESGRLISAKEAERRVLVLENPGIARRVVHHAHAVLRACSYPARRGRAEPSPHAIGAALRRRRRGRLYRRRRRAHDDASGRFHHHAVGDLARPWQPRRRAGGLDGRPRHPAVRMLDAASPSAIRKKRSRSAAPKATRMPRYGTNLVPIDYEPRVADEPAVRLSV